MGLSSSTQVPVGKTTRENIVNKCICVLIDLNVGFTNHFFPLCASMCV